MTKKKIKCPKCGDTWFTMWCSGEIGYNIRYDEKSGIISNGIEYEEVAFELYSCGCGYETTNENDILVVVRE